MYIFGLVETVSLRPRKPTHTGCPESGGSRRCESFLSTARFVGLLVKDYIRDPRPRFVQSKESEGYHVSTYLSCTPKESITYVRWMNLVREEFTVVERDEPFTSV